MSGARGMGLRAAVVALAAVAFLGWVRPARATLAVEARGQAQVVGGDAAAARRRALDDAFRQVVDQGITALVDAQARATHADVIRKRILRRARAFVPTFRVLTEGEQGGRYHVHIQARLADAQLSAELRALGVIGGGSAAPPERAAPVTGPAGPGRPPLALLAVTADGARAWATFGRRADQPGPVAPILEAALERLGFDVRPVPGADVPISAEAAGGARLPLDSDQARRMAARAGAGGAIVAGIQLRDGGPIRGTALVGAELELALRVDDVAAGSVVEHRVVGAGFGPTAEAAAVSAARPAAARAVAAVGRRLAARWPEPAAPETPGIAVHVQGSVRWPEVAALGRTLAALPGVKQVVPTRFAAGVVTLVVRGAATARTVAAAAAGAQVAGTRFAPRVRSARDVHILVSVDVGMPEPLGPDR